MDSLSVRIKRRIALTAGRVRYELFPRALSERDVRSRLVHAVRERLPAGAAFWTELYADYLKRSPQNIRECGSRFMTERAAAIERALSARAMVLGRELQIPKDFDWNTDLFFNVPWQRNYYRCLADKRPGSDLVLLWMPNRMLHLLDLSGAYAATGDERYAQEWVRQAEAWCRANPRCVGMNWRSPLEIGIRLFVFNLGLAELAGSRSLDSPVLSVLIPSIILQAEHLAAHFSYWDGNANNHLIGEAATLYAHASMWSCFEQAGEWRTLGCTVFEREILKQVRPDGIDFENALNYHAQVLDFSLLFQLFLHKNGAVPAPACLDRLRQMAAAYVTLLSPRGRLPRFGDDTAREFLLLEESDDLEGRPLGDPVRFESVVSLPFRAPLREAPAMEPLLDTSVPLDIARSYPQSGFATVRTPRSQLTYYAGLASGQPFHRGHLHSDLASFELEIDGNSVFIDSGTYLYFYDEELRNHFRGTRAHNTIMVDGHELMERSATFSWRRVQKAQGVLQITKRDAVIVLSRHRAGGSGFIHTRIVIQSDAWLIFDHLQPVDGQCCNERSHDHHLAEAVFHTPFRELPVASSGAAVDIDLEPVPGSQMVPTRWRFAGYGSGEYQMQTLSGPEALLAGYSPRYGERRQGTAIVASVQFAGAVSLCHILHGREDGSAAPSVECSHTRAEVVFSAPHEVWECSFDPFSLKRNGTILAGEPLPGFDTEEDGVK